MGRAPCSYSKQGLNKGPWTPEEDSLLIKFIEAHGEGRWCNLPMNAGLRRCGKSCRLRWKNHLRPNIKRSDISPEEEDLIIRLHKLLGNRWSLIAGRVPGRTDNQVKNYWNTRLSKKAAANKCNGLKTDISLRLTGGEPSSCEPNIAAHSQNCGAKPNSSLKENQNPMENSKKLESFFSDSSENKMAKSMAAVKEEPITACSDHAVQVTSLLMEMEDLPNSSTLDSINVFPNLKLLPLSTSAGLKDGTNSGKCEDTNSNTHMQNSNPVKYADFDQTYSASGYSPLPFYELLGSEPYIEWMIASESNQYITNPNFSSTIQCSEMLDSYMQLPYSSEIGEFDCSLYYEQDSYGTNYVNDLWSLLL